MNENIELEEMSEYLKQNAIISIEFISLINKYLETKDINICNCGGFNLLMLACNDNQIEYAKLLIKNGINLNNLSFGYMASALMIASIKGNEEMVKLLLDNGADVDLRNVFGENAIRLASNSGHANISCIILNKIDKDKEEKLNEEFSRTLNM